MVNESWVMLSVGALSADVPMAVRVSKNFVDALMEPLAA